MCATALSHTVAHHRAEQHVGRQVHVGHHGPVGLGPPGQYGVALRLFAPSMNDTEFGFYFINYHSRLPLVNGLTGTVGGAIGAGTIAAAAPTIVPIVFTE